jgi:hypothetical protein
MHFEVSINQEQARKLTKKLGLDGDKNAGAN